MLHFASRSQKHMHTSHVVDRLVGQVLVWAICVQLFYLVWVCSFIQLDRFVCAQWPQRFHMCLSLAQM